MTSRAQMAALFLMAGCWQARPVGVEAPYALVAAESSAGVEERPLVALMTDAELAACAACDVQSLEGGPPVRYAHLPAISRDGSLLAVVEEGDGDGHVERGVRFIDRQGRSVEWIGYGNRDPDSVAAIARVNAVLAEHQWRSLEMPRFERRDIDDEHVEVTLWFGRYTAVFQQANEGNYWLPPSRIRVTTGPGRVVAERTDTETTWGAGGTCNLPSFELVGVSEVPGAMLFKTGLGMGGHECDGVRQPPTWHVLAFR